MNAHFVNLTEIHHAENCSFTLILALYGVMRCDISPTGSWIGKSTEASICARKIHHPAEVAIIPNPPATNCCCLAKSSLPMAVFQYEPVKIAKSIIKPKNIDTKTKLVLSEQTRNIRLSKPMNNRKKPGITVSLTATFRGTRSLDKERAYYRNLRGIRGSGGLTLDYSGRWNRRHKH